MMHGQKNIKIRLELFSPLLTANYKYLSSLLDIALVVRNLDKKNVQNEVHLFVDKRHLSLHSMKCSMKQSA
jgi:hypothetical protein